MNLSRPLILASKSPRRQQILQEAGFTFRCEARPVEEVYPEDMPLEDVPGYLAKLKSDAFGPLTSEILLTSDTVVLLEGELLGKPADEAEAMAMLRRLSGKMHRVITAVCLRTAEKTIIFDDRTDVYFRHLPEDEIRQYVSEKKPLDKAGAYGIQDRIGMIGIERINGSYLTVMGLPVHKVYDALQPYATGSA